MTTSDSSVDFGRLVETTQALGHALGIDHVAADAIEHEARAILRQRSLLEGVEMGVITEREAAGALLARLMTWMLGTRLPPGLTDFSPFEQATIQALFGQHAHPSPASRDRV